MLLEFKLLLLLLVANGAPIIARELFGARFALPLDGGVRFIDGRLLLGPSKTVRGLVAAIVATTFGAPLLGLPWGVGMLMGAAAMLGDLLSSLCKRRLGLAPSSRAVGLDQIPEALLPLLACQGLLGLGWSSIVGVTAAFFVSELLLSRLLYRLRIRRTPY